MLLQFALLLALLLQEPSWLDPPTVTPWNEPGMAIPTPQTPNDFGLDPRCVAGNSRPAETPQDQALVDAGWTLFAPFRGGWGMLMIDGASGFDGMCRPMGFNEFVFVDGTFAGTISPDPMSSRFDGVGDVTSLRADSLTARFIRYAPTDALCCPSRGAVIIEYRIDRTPNGPVVVPFRRSVEPPATG